ncbi:MAG: GntR family transcriptional regulator [Candidatus Rokuibacteriota bacterium]
MNYRPGVPRYLQIADAIRSELLGEGERIPSEHQLCAQFTVSRPTIRQALDVLVQEGRLYRHAGRGTFSTPTPGGDRKLRVIGSVDDMIALGDETWFKLVTREVVRVPANIAQALRLPPGSEAYRIVGVRHADVGPFQHVTAHLPLAIGEALSDEDVSKTSLIGAIERQLGVPIKVLDQVTDAALAPRHVAELLQVRPRTPLLLFERIYFAMSGEPVEHAVTYQSSRRYPFRIVLARPERRS